MAGSGPLRYDGHRSDFSPIATVGPAFRSTIRAIGTPTARGNWQNCARRNTNNNANEAAGPMPPTQQRNIRFTTEQWERIENAAREREVSPNQLVADLALEALNRREWPRTEAEIRVARASLFAAQALARGLIADGREDEVQEIREFISGIVPDVDKKLPASSRSSPPTPPSRDEEQSRPR
ncbi:MAG: hypothetical protein OXI22_06650 [Defluviicoccus sp.]|nr:hypothetical protein [Defluviicoccus sp.]MDE2914571.1 hypothetical protein [Paracoccaceae bacterium]